MVPGMSVNLNFRADLVMNGSVWPRGDPVLRTWQDVIEKWQLSPPEAQEGPTEARLYFDRALSALVKGRLDDAAGDFERAAATRESAYDDIGIGDVFLARGRWRAAAAHYRRAAERDPGNVLAVLGMSQARVASGDARGAAADLEARFGGSTDPVLRYYLASTWCSVSEQVRSRTADDALVITSEHQLEVCEAAARRIIDLDVRDAELRRGAELLLDEVTAGRRWRWQPEGIAVSLAVLAVSLGLILVAVGGLAGNVSLVIAGVLLGGGLLYLIVVRFRRQTWQSRADALAESIVQRGAD
ncbi:Tetratricopeptide repeat-containing protein [Actinokineospora alba]|uniref:Tetratricopeptide repeat-containing protein n=1 Tax=Actinokineospora alba TaxID=504798 RepID=A0A1H0HIX1_9PSEU|nr:tetratricopeptide repeat protein [Actinokineospora alba]SDH48042.1 Tetratricopeptide repeat-containing protein [Actinokineospora alba]SDO18983.1 Tetratricopeptide repeat-containing protein [Actinokineospora alba]